MEVVFQIRINWLSDSAKRGTIPEGTYTHGHEKELL